MGFLANVKLRRKLLIAMGPLAIMVIFESVYASIQSAIPTGPLSPVAGADSLVISGIDTAVVLKRTGGNLKRYESLLHRFAESQTTVVSDIQAAIIARNTPTAQRLAHSLKGAAANPGVSSLAEVTAKAESAIHANQGVPLALETLSHSLVLTAAEIDYRIKKVSNFAYSSALQSLSAIAARLSTTLE